MSLLNGRVLLAALMTTVFAGMLAMGWTYPPNARLMPFVIGVPGLALCLTQLTIEIMETLRNGKPEDDITGREALFFLWFPTFIGAVLAFGFLVASVVMVAAFLRLSQEERWKTALSFSIGGSIAIYVVFEVILGLEMFRGFLYPLLID